MAISRPKSQAYKIVATDLVEQIELKVNISGRKLCGEWRRQCEEEESSRLSMDINSARYQVITTQFSPTVESLGIKMDT